MHAVSKAIIDVAFTEAQPPVVLNIVHPRPVEWSTIMRDVNDALLAANVTTNILPMVPFSQWFEELEGRAKIADGLDFSDIVNSYPSPIHLSNCFGFSARHQTPDVFPNIFVS
jgi:hypothetical protein